MTDAQREQKRKAGRARARQFTPEYQSQCGKARAARGDMAEIGHKGFAVTVARHGYTAWLQHGQKRRLAHPSPLEIHIAAILNELGVDYEREAIVLRDTERPLIVDFATRPGHMLIEVNGEPHTRPGMNGGQLLGRWDRDQARLRRLQEAGYHVLVIDHHDLNVAEELIKKFLGLE